MDFPKYGDLNQNVRHYQRESEVNSASLESQEAPLRANQSDLLVSFCRNFSCSNPYLPRPQRQVTLGVAFEVVASSGTGISNIDGLCTDMV